MTTAEIIKQMEKELDVQIQSLIFYTQGTNDPIDNQYYQNHLKLVQDTINKSIRTLLESFGEEIIGEDDDKEVFWKEGCHDVELECDNSSRNFIRAEQRLKVKEILEVIK